LVAVELVAVELVVVELVVVELVSVELVSVTVVTVLVLVVSEQTPRAVDEASRSGACGGQLGWGVQLVSRCPA